METLEVFYLRVRTAIQSAIDVESVNLVVGARNERKLTKAERKMFRGRIAGLRRAQGALNAVYHRTRKEYEARNER